MSTNTVSGVVHNVPVSTSRMFSYHMRPHNNHKLPRGIIINPLVACELFLSMGILYVTLNSHMFMFIFVRVQYPYYGDGFGLCLL